MASISYKRKISLMTRLRYLAEAATVYFFYGLFSLMPVERASAMGGAIMRYVGPKLAASRKAERHVGFAMPECDEATRKKIVTEMWDNLGRVFAEYPHLKTLDSRITVIDGKYLESAINQGRGGIMVGGHFANWEAYTVVARKYHMPINLVYRKPNNFYLDGLLTRARGQGGATSNIPKTVEGARLMMKILKQGGYIGALIDQKFNEGIEVPFFDKPAMTAPAVTQLAQRLDVPLHPARIRRLENARFEVTIFPAIKVPESGSREEKSYQMLLELHALFENWIRAEPGQWLWLHRRWKDV